MLLRYQSVQLPFLQLRPSGRKGLRRVGVGRDGHLLIALAFLVLRVELHSDHA